MNPETIIPLGDGDFLLRLIMGLNLLATLYLTFGRLRGNSEKREIIHQPLKIELARQFATTKDLETFKHETNNRFLRLESHIREDIKDLSINSDERVRKLHERINTLSDRLLEAIGQIKARI